MRASLPVTVLSVLLFTFLCCCEPVFGQRTQADLERFYARSQTEKETSDGPELRSLGLLRPSQPVPARLQEPTERNTEAAESMFRATSSAGYSHPLVPEPRNSGGGRPPAPGYSHPLVPAPRGYVGGSTWASLERVQVERIATVRPMPAPRPARLQPLPLPVMVLRPPQVEKVQLDRVMVERPNIVRPVFDRVAREGGSEQADLNRILQGTSKRTDLRLPVDERVAVPQPGAVAR